LVTVLLTVALGTIFSYVENPWGVKIFTVLTDSMQPEMSTGYLIATQPREDYEVGDVITYKPKSGRLGGQVVDTVTHRISEISTIEEIEYFFTKGDSNKAQDVDPTAEDHIVGQVVFKIPLLGYLIEFAKTEIGLITMIIIPGVIIVYDEIRKIIQTLKTAPQTIE